MRGNPDLRSALARLEMARAKVEAARAEYAPTLYFGHQSTRVFETPALRDHFGDLLQSVPIGSEGGFLGLSSLGAALGLPTDDDYSGNSNSFSEHITALAAQWVVFDGFVREATLQGARYLEEATAASYDDVVRLLSRAVDQAYYQVQLAGERLRITEADESFSREQLDQTQKLFAAGRVSQADVDNFRVRVLAAQAAVTGSKGLIDTGRTVLAELMGLPGAVLPDATTLSPLGEESAADLTPPRAESLIESAVEARPDLRRSERLLRSEEQRVVAAKGRYYPSVGVGAAWGFNRGANLNYDEDDQIAAAAVEMQWEIFSGGRRQSRVREAEAGRLEALAQRDRLELAIASEIRRAATEVAAAQEQIQLQRQRLAAATENRRIVQAAYLAGKEPLTRLNETQRDFIAADADLTLARIRLRQAWSELNSAAARTITP